MTQNNFKAIALAFTIALTLTFTSCKKDALDDTSNFTSISDDGTRVNNETDAVANDANAALEASPSLSGQRMEGNGINLPCDATIVYDTTSTNRTITITYNGSNCYNTRTRTGVVTIAIPVGVKWGDKGATVTVTFNNLKVTRLSDSKSIVFNGTKTYTNVTGGLLKNLATLGHIEHQITSSDMSITFDNGDTRNWNIARQRDFTYNNGIVISETGIGSDGEAMWGTNRFGDAFSISVSQPVVEEQSCDWQITSGQVVYAKLNRTLTVTLGLDASGNEQTSCPGLGGFYWEATWTDAKGKAHQVIHRY